MRAFLKRLALVALLYLLMGLYLVDAVWNDGAVVEFLLG